MTPLLSIRALSVEFDTRHGTVHALDRLSLDIAPGEIIGIIGESGSGKSVTAHAVMGILDRAARITGGEVLFQGENLLEMGRRARDGWRGRGASIIFQNPRAALNPIRAVGDQIADVVARHSSLSRRAIRARVLELLRHVRIPDPERRARAYPFQLSGGLCQRIGIAMALACAPRLLIADEPTTGLDVTTQAAIMALIRERAREAGTAVALITHDVALAAGNCDRLAIMHAGHVVEVAPTAAILARPRHPYTAGLLRSVPSLAGSLDQLQAIPGSMPDLRRPDLPPCRFAERCPRRLPRCDAPGPLALTACGPGHLVACRNLP
ncbi:ABC transporter ATP-binding protein [Paracoccus alkenifer]|uniref:Oligopeptide/dipeptide ABC transporter, ATP-binding protein, C-terminal domain-containing protein n=1 Tax=Paracoccus alkenifer TaxID=65735 RepID=A0A1H6NCE5_9RHOB|nr:ABC transporter ATP-binding protein [Paracoccus alkenifer]SEI12726.1 oligopeptide/dipeptide ABC transporter, ATP-binding protein, C-terminal domain-containing protein [Paracoccus alkenifer]